MEKYNNLNLTKEEQDKINKELEKLGKYSSLEVIHNGNIIDLVRKERIRVRGNNYFNKG